MGFESSLMRKRTTFAISSGWTHLEWSAFGWLSLFASVSMTLGRIALARIPSWRYSASRVWTKDRTAALLTM